MRLVLAFSVFLLAACSDRSPAPVVQQLPVSGAELTPVFAVTNRQRNEEGFFDRERQEELSFLSTVVSIPPKHTPGDAPIYNKNPNPEKHFALVQQDQFSSDKAFVNAVRRELQKRPPHKREVTIYVHGYYNGFSDSVFRMAQMHKDFNMEGVPVAFSWPSAGKPTGYTYDRDSALFARDSLQDLINLVSQTGARNVLVLAHSMGGLVVMETLRQMDLERPGSAASKVGAVVLMSPDISVDVFRAQVDSIKRLPEPFVVVTSKKDSALRISTRVNMEADRLGLGNSVSELVDLPITFVDVTSFNDDGSNSHFLVAESPTLVALLASVENMPGHIQSADGTLLGGIGATSTHVQSAVEVALYPDLDEPQR